MAQHLVFFSCLPLFPAFSQRVNMHTQASSQSRFKHAWAQSCGRRMIFEHPTAPRLFGNFRAKLHLLTYKSIQPIKQSSDKVQHHVIPTMTASFRLARISLKTLHSHRHLLGR